MSMELWWIHSDRGNPKCSEKNLSYCDYVQLKCHMRGGGGDVEFLGQLNTCCLLKKGCIQWSELLELLENFKTYT